MNPIVNDVSKQYQILFISKIYSAVDELCSSLEDRFHFESQHVTTMQSLEEALQKHLWDLILCVSEVSDPDIFTTIELAKRLQPKAAVIVISNNPTSHDVVDIMRHGASAVVEITDYQYLLEIIRQELLSSSSTFQQDNQHSANQNGLNNAATIREYLNDILDMSQDSIVSISLPDRTLLYVTNAFAQIFGYSIKDFLNDAQFFQKVVHPDDLELATKAMQECLEKGFVDLEHRIIWPNGQIRWIHRRAWVSYDKNKHPVRVNDSARDITVRKETELALRASEEKYRTLIESTDSSISMLDSSGCYLYLNTISAAPFGTTPEALIGKSVHDLFPTNEANSILSDIQEVIGNGFGKTLETTATISGKRCWFRTSIQPIRDGAGQAFAVLIHATEYTAVKEAELALRNSEARYRSIVEDQTELVCRYDKDLKITFGNLAYCKAFGVNPNEIIGKSFFDKIPHYQHESARAHIQSMTPDSPTAISVHQSIQPDGSLRWFEWKDRAIFAENGELIEYQGVARDITNQKRAEEALRTSEEKYRSLIESSDSCIAMYNQDGELLYANAKASILLGNQPESNKNGSLNSILRGSQEAIHEVIASGMGQVIEERQIIQNEERWFRSSIQPVRDGAGHITSALINATDITRFKLAEAALRQNEAHLRSLVDSQTAFNIRVDMQGKITYYNQRYEQTFKWYAPSFIGMSALDMIVPEDHPLVYEVVAQCLTEPGKPVQVEIRKQAPNNSFIWTLWEFIALLGDSGQVEEVQCVGFEITKQKLAEVSLRESELRYRQMFELHGLPKLIIDPETGAIVDANPAAGHFYGYDVFDLNTMTIFDLNLSPIDEVRTKMNKASTSGMLSCEFIHRGAKNQPRDVEVFTGPVEVNGKQLLYSIITDVTEKQRAKVALQKAHDTLEQRVIERTAELERSKDRIEAIFNHSGDGIVLLDIKHGIQQGNYAFDEMFDFTDDSYIGSKLTTVFDPNDEEVIQKGIDLAASAHQVQHLEVRAQRKDSSSIDVEISIAPVNRSDKAVSSLVCIIRDITERKLAQRAIAEERNLLRTVIDTVPDFIYVKDVNHRMLLNNKAHARSLGIANPNDAIGKSDTELFPPNLGAKFQADDIRVLETGQAIVNTEERSLGEDGNEIWALTTKVPLYNLYGKLIGLVGITRNVTEIKHKEEALRQREKQLRESQNMLQMVLDTIPVRVFWKDRNSVYLGCNYLFAQDAGLKETTAIVGKTDLELPWSREETAGFVENDRLIIQDGVPEIELEEVQHVADGNTLISRTNKFPLRNADNEIIGVLGSYIDITRRKLAEEALAHQQEHEREMQVYLTNLHKTTLRLTRTETLDAFYRIAVEEGLSKFGFERIGLLLFDPVDGSATGTYGTDPSGNVVKEYDLRLDPASLTGILKRTLDRAERFAFDDAAQLFANFQPIGTGQNAVAALWNGEVLGWLAVDNGVRHQPISKAQLDILALYALTTGSLLARKRAEFALRDSEERYRLLAENVHDLIVRYSNEDGLCTYASPSCQSLLGYTADELVGKPLFDFVHPIDRLHSAEAGRLAFEMNEDSFTVIHRVLHKNGTYRWFEATNTLIRDPSRQHLIEGIAVFREITERKQAEDALRASEEKFRLFIESAPIATIITDQNGQIVLVNKATEKLFGYGRNELIGNPIELLVPEESREVHVAHRATYSESPMKHRSSNMELAGHRKDKSTFPADIELSYINIANEIMVMSYVIDITARKQAEAALREALEQEKELGELKSRFVSMASHEFRTPLAVILATTETLSIYRERMDASQINARLDKIHRQVIHMKDIMEDVLQLARIQAGRVEFRPVEGDLDILCREIIEEFESQVQYPGRIIYQVANAPVILEYDERLMRQIISNLIGNALKYSPNEKPIQVILTHEDDELIFQVRDEGIGIPPEDIKRLFEPFHRASNVGTLSGTGLGLSITKQAVGLHKGTIVPESQVDKGTTFTVRIPIQSSKDVQYDQNSHHRG
ncbi:MAG TPA: PAS domain S-box protein [Aggregatilineales bacterium]|nr:PAS domain S-box protein [Aggregatilineales bacterium]